MSKDDIDIGMYADLFIRVEHDDFAELVLLHALGHDGGGHTDEEGHGRGQVIGQVPRQDGDVDVLPVHRIDQRVGSLPCCRNLDIFNGNHEFMMISLPQTCHICAGFVKSFFPRLRELASGTRRRDHVT